MKNQSYDLKERTEKFAKDILLFCLKLPRNAVTTPIITQLVRSGTSIGANYFEANDAESKLDFRHKIGIAKKEASETIYWLNLIQTALPDKEKTILVLRNEVKEIHLIFNSIFNKCK